MTSLVKTCANDPYISPNLIHYPMPRQTVIRNSQMDSAHVVASSKSTESAGNIESTIKAYGKGIKLVSKIVLWYFLSSVYNIYNKKALLQLGDMPWTIATIQMGMGILIVVPLWILKLRSHSFDSVKSIVQYLRLISVESVFQVLTHTAGVIALGLGSVSFTHIVKAGEPFFTATLCYFVLNQTLRPQVILALVTIIAGVSLSSASEATFSWQCLLAGLASNVFSAARVVRTKWVQLQQQKSLEKLQQATTATSSNTASAPQLVATGKSIEPQLVPLLPENNYALSTMLSFVMLVPFTLLIEGSKISTTLRSVSNIQNYRDGYINALIAGVLIYAYNELSFSVLAEVRRPTTHAVANTLRRVAVIVTSVIIFGYRLPAIGVFGAVLSMAGVLWYSLLPQQSPSAASAVKVKT